MTFLNLCYLAAVPMIKLNPGMTLSHLIQHANARDQISLRKCVRLNWMIQDLFHGQLRKPIFVDDKFNIIAGDTRYMALTLLQHSWVPCLAQLSDAQGQVLTTLPQLRQVLGFSHDATVQWQPMTRNIFSEPIEWFEIGDTSTAHHLHDENIRGRMINNYLAEFPHTVFDHSWFMSKIDWQAWDNLSGQSLPS